MGDGAYRPEVGAWTAARILDLPLHEIEALCEQGKLHARRIGERGWWRIDYESLLEFLEHQ